MISRYYIAKNLQDVDALIQACKSTGYCSFDYETNAEPLYTNRFTPTLLSITFQPGSSVCIPLDHFERDKYTDGFCNNISYINLSLKTKSKRPSV